MVMPFLAAHIVFSVVITALSRSRASSGGTQSLPVVWLVPFAGAALFFADLYLQKQPDAKKGYRLLGALPDDLDKVEEDADRDEDLIVPVEEAMVEEDEEIRRRLMFHLLDARESDNIRLLQKIAASDDTELAHFASTRVMAFRRDHEEEIADKARMLETNPGDRVTLERYCALLKEYLDSGILPSSIAQTYRASLKDGYEKLIAADPNDMDHREAYLQFLMEPGVADEEIKKAVEGTLEAFPDEMRSYRLAAGFHYLQKNRNGLDETLRQVKERNVYLNQAGRRWYAFWKGEAE